MALTRFVKYPLDSLVIPLALLGSGLQRNSFVCVCPSRAVHLSVHNLRLYSRISVCLADHGTLMSYVLSRVSAPSFAALSASSFPSIPMCAYTHSSLVLMVISATAFRACAVSHTVFDFISSMLRASIAA